MKRKACFITIVSNKPQTISPLESRLLRTEGGKNQIRDSLTIAWRGRPSSWSRVRYGCLLRETDTATASSSRCDMGGRVTPPLAPPLHCLATTDAAP